MKEYTVKLTEAEIAHLISVCTGSIVADAATAEESQWVTMKEKAKKSATKTADIREKLKMVVRVSR